MALESMHMLALPDIEISPEQHQAVLRTAAELVRDVVLSRKAQLTDPAMGGVADKPISGLFVSLKRGPHLRGCCGGLRSQPVPLKEILIESSYRTAQEDARFPPVSPSELDFLDVELWLLGKPQRVQVAGEERSRAVVVGKHGVAVSRGPNHGLFLPCVAPERGWNARRLLEQVCLKAKLHPSLWKDEETTLMTFAGEAVRGRLAELVGSEIPRPEISVLTRDELAAYAEFLRGNLIANLAGAAPRYSVPEIPDAQVQAIGLRLAGDLLAEPLEILEISLRPGLALQATLFQMARAAALQLASTGVEPGQVRDLLLHLAVMHDAAVHGTLDAPDLRGINVERRAILVVEQNRKGLAFHSRVSGEDLLHAAARRARTQPGGSALVFSLHVATTESTFTAAVLPRPRRGPAVRPPAVAGRFYPADPAQLDELVDELLAGEPGLVPRQASAALVPHAGLLYSGRLAASVLKRLKIPKHVIVIGPKHTRLGVEFAVAPYRAWALPGRTVAADFKLARQITAAVPGLALDALAHQNEHAIEIELPLLARLAPETSVVGIAIGRAGLGDCRRMAGNLAEFLETLDEPPLLLISSDMNHFATDAETRVLDELAIAAMERLDPRDLYDTVRMNRISMCGVLPAFIVLETLRLLGRLQRATRVGHATSGDVSGDRSRVVGYAGMIFE